MKAYVLYGPKDLRLDELRPDPKVGQNDVLIRVRRTGICGSDVHYFDKGQIGEFVPRAPFALGHEFAGDVVQLGAGADRFTVGDRVAIDPSMPCGTCDYCRRGRYNLCDSMRFLGSASCYPHIDGGFSEYVAMPQSNCYRIPDGLDYGYAALVEPLTIATHAILRSTVAGGVAGRTVVITGAGTIGHLTLLVARAYGASVVAVSDPEEFPREEARRAGADYAFDPRDGELDSFAQSNPVDVVIEVSGAAPALAQGIRLLRRGGTLVQVGTQPPKVELPANLVMSKELAVLGSFRSAHDMRPALDLAVRKTIDLTSVISTVYPFSEFKKAMDVAVAKKRVIKIQVEQESGA